MASHESRDTRAKDLVTHNLSLHREDGYNHCHKWISYAQSYSDKQGHKTSQVPEITDVLPNLQWPSPRTLQL